MKVRLITYCTDDFSWSSRILRISARFFGADNCKTYTPSKIQSSDFYHRNKKILQQPRGAGYWLWKPYIISRELESLKENDILIYADSGLFIRKSLRPLLDLVNTNEHMAVFCNDIPLGKYTKRDLLIATESDTPEFRGAPMIHAGFQIYRNCEESRTFIEHVLKLSTTDDLITDAPSVFSPNEHPEFQEHRHDQSIFSVLALKYGKTLYLDPTQFQKRKHHYRFRSEHSDLPNPLPYNRIVYVHRYRNGKLHLLFADIFKKLFRQ